MESNARMVSMFGGDKTMIMGGNFTHITQSPELRDARKVLAQSIAEGARHDSAERYSAPTCHPNTRVAVIENIMYWINSPLDSDQPKIKWLNGAAGAGKSAIMQTVAESCASEGTLGGSFFFKRSDYQRGVAKHLVSTLAYQLCQTIPEVRSYIETAVDLDPKFLSLSLPTQFTKLILNPLRAVVHQLKGPILIVIDGLDECIDHKVQEHIISLLNISRDSDSNRPLIPFRFLIASRRESQIVSTFSSASSSASTSLFTKINLTNNSFGVNEDIRLYTDAKFDIIRTKRGIPFGWPTKSDLDHILKLSSGQFIFSSTVISYVDSDDHHPHVRLQQILQRIPYSTDENPFASLDALYSHIFSEVPQSHLATVKIILPIYLGVYISPLWDQVPMHDAFADDATSCGPRVQPEDVRNVERVLGLAEGDTRVSLRRLSAVVSCEYSDKIGGHQIQVHHASLGDFLNAEDRSGRFFLGDRRTQMQNYISRVLSAALYPFLQDNTKLANIHDTRFDHTNCECAEDIQLYRTTILHVHLAGGPNPERPPLCHSDIHLINRIDFAKVFDDSSPINRTCRSMHISYIADYLWQQQQDDPLKEPERTVLLALNSFVSQQLLSNYSPNLSRDYNAGDLLQIFLNVEGELISFAVYPNTLRPLPCKESFPGDSLFVERIFYTSMDVAFYSGYSTLLSRCAQVIAAQHSWTHIVSDPAYQSKLVHLFLQLVAGETTTLLRLVHPVRTVTLIRRLRIAVGYRSYYRFKRVLGKFLPNAAFSPEIMLLVRVVRRCKAVIEREAEHVLQHDEDYMVILREVPRTNDGIEDYLSRHRYCDETCRKARHDTLIEQVDRAWKDWNEDLKRHGPRCTQVIIPPLKALIYITQLLKFVDILQDFVHILAVYHIISNPDMVVFYLARHLIPIVNFVIIARVWFRQ